MKTALRASLCALALIVTSPPRPARACGGSYSGPTYINRHNPDLPLSRLREGHVGVIPADRGWHRADLVVAWRALTNAPLTEGEYAGWVARVRATHPGALPLEIDPNVPVEASSDDEGGYQPDVSDWYRARAEVIGDRGPQIVNEWLSRGAWTPNCLRDAFVSASAVLLARQREYGARSDVVRGWVEAQDAVFSNCGGDTHRTPLPLSPNAPEAARRDRAWQIAAAHFYAARFEDAERAFRTIAADTGSPWSQLARYLVVRTITRAAQRGRETPDVAELGRALREAEALLADPRATGVREMTARYRGWLRAQHDPAGRAHELGVALASADDHFAEDVRDYDRVLEATSPDPFARQPNDADRLTAWIGALEGRRASADSTPRSVAIENYRRSRANVWLVAALIAPGDARDESLAPILEAARAVPREDPAYASARYHRLRLLSARGAPVYDEALALAATLTDGDGATARNLVRELAAGSAPDIERFVSAAHGAPAGWDGSEGFITAPDPHEATGAADDLSPLGAAVITSQIPLSSLFRAARVTGLPASIHDRLVSAAMLRATLLDDDLTRMAVKALLPSVSEVTRRALRPLAEAETRDARRLELARILVHGSADVDPGTAMGDAALDANVRWVPRCETTAPTTSFARFLTPPERAAHTRERQRMSALGGGAAWLANELSRLAPLSLRDPEMPALLASAVRGTRNNGCPPGAAIHTASRAAFTALHRYFPRSAEARDTRYWY